MNISEQVTAFCLRYGIEMPIDVDRDCTENDFDTIMDHYCGAGDFWVCHYPENNHTSYWHSEAEAAAWLANVMAKDDWRLHDKHYRAPEIARQRDFLRSYFQHCWDESPPFNFSFAQFSIAISEKVPPRHR